MPNDGPLKDGKYISQEFKAFEEGRTVESGNGLQSTLKRDIARARLQLAITQALCAYIEEMNVPERVGLTQIDFEHHGARVSVKVEIGEAVVQEMKLGKPMTIREKFDMMQALAGDDGRLTFVGEGLNTSRLLRRDSECDETCKYRQCGHKSREMYTSREDQERYGNG